MLSTHVVCLAGAGAGGYGGPAAALAGLGHVGVASAASRLGPAGVDPITGQSVTISCIGQYSIAYIVDKMIQYPLLVSAAHALLPAGARMGLGSGGNPGGSGLHPLAAAAAGLPGQMGTGSTTTTVLTGSTATLPALGPVGFLPVANRNDNPPCNTLFIGNLSDQVTSQI
jgi:hypothetical protein